MPPRAPDLRARPWALALCLLVGACGGGPSVPEDDASILDLVDLDGLFAPATAAEVATVSREWEGRNPSAAGIVTEFDGSETVGFDEMRVRIVSHDVEGVRHYGAVLAAEGLTEPAPVVVYAHGGDDGTSIEEVLLLFTFMGQEATDFVWVVPSYRSESIGYGGGSWTSGGEASPWDRDVDDTIALLDVALEIEPNADADNVGVLGFSRGGGVALLMGIRDERVDRVVEFFGPTDFFAAFMRDIVEESLLAAPPDLPSVDDLDARLIQPWAVGTLSTTEARLELVRRSPVLFAERLPDVQLHHGTADPVVPVGQAEALIAVMEVLGRTAPGFDATLYAGGDHNPLSLSGSVAAAIAYLSALVAVP